MLTVPAVLVLLCSCASCSSFPPGPVISIPNRGYAYDVVQIALQSLQRLRQGCLYKSRPWPGVGMCGGVLPVKDLSL